MTTHSVLVAGILSVLCLGADPSPNASPPAGAAQMGVPPSAAPQAGAPASDQAPIATLPCVVGDSWTYKFTAKSVTGSGLNGSETFTRTGCGDRIVLHPSGSLLKADITSDASGNILSGYSLFTGGSERFKKPFPYYRLPLAPGAKWDAPVDIDVSGDSLTGTGHWSTVGWETITVAAGTFNCLRKETKMDYDFSGNFGSASGSYKETSWYCPALRAEAKSVSSDSFGESASHELTAVALKS